MTMQLRQKPFYPMLLAAIMAFALTNAMAQPAGSEGNLQEFSKQINTLLKENRQAEALPLIRQFNQQYPGHPSVLYNLACAENTAGNASAAINALSLAIGAGFDDLHQAQNDPDLQSLTGEPGFQALVLEHDLAMATESHGRGFTISEGNWSPYQELSPQSPQPGDTLPAMQMRVNWQSVGLLFEITGSHPNGSNPPIANSGPLAGGDAVFVAIAIAGGTSTWESDNNFQFVFGHENDRLTGAFYLATQNHWQPVEELVPKFRQNYDDGSFHYTFTLPWQILEPFHPLVDANLGINVTVRQTSEAGPVIHALVQDPAAFQANRPWHRYAIMASDLSNIGEVRLQGRLSHSISGSHPVTLDLNIISPTAGSGSLRMDFLNSQDFSVLDESRSDMTLDLNQGSNAFTWPVDFSSLRTGPYLVRAVVDFPGGESLTWETPVLHLQPGWIDAVSGYLENIPAKEKATATLVIDTITKAIPELKNRRNPQAIGKTLYDLLGMADRAKRFGSILPGEGSFVLAYPGINDDQQLCSVFFPPGYRDAAELLPVLILNNYRGYETRMAERMDRFYQYWANAPDPENRASETVPVYISPHLGPEISGIGQDGAPSAANSAQWAADFFAAPEIAVAGIDASLGDALGLVAINETPLAAMFLVAGREVRIWPQANLDFIARKLPAPPGNLPINWLEFPYETRTVGQAPDILAAMEQNNWNIIKSKTVKGALGITQVTDRIILWAENLR